MRDIALQYPSDSLMSHVLIIKYDSDVKLYAYVGKDVLKEKNLQFIVQQTNSNLF